MSDQPVAVVTAASKGIGAACVRRLAADGYRVALMSRSDAGAALAEEISGVWVQGDLTVDDDIASRVEVAASNWGRLDATIINTGHLPTGQLLDLTDEQWGEGLHAIGHP